MTKGECGKILTVMAYTFPNFRPEDPDGIAAVWADILSGYDYTTINAALKAYILTDTTGFAPTIGQLIARVNSHDEMEDMKAWAMVRKALRNGIYGAEEEYAKLPPAVQDAVGDKSSIEAWATLPSEEIETVIQSQFLRSYRSVKVKREERMKISAGRAEQIEKKEET